MYEGYYIRYLVGLIMCYVYSIVGFSYYIGDATKSNKMVIIIL